MVEAGFLSPARAADARADAVLAADAAHSPDCD
jgi:hypothetical protein